MSDPPPLSDALGPPDHGARLVVRLKRSDAESAAYDVTLAMAEESWQGSAVVREGDGEVTPGSWSPGEPPSWLAQALHALLRSAWQRRRSGSPWPRRLARWRPAPESASGA